MNFIARNPPVTSAPTANTPKYMEFKWFLVLRRSLILTSILLADILTTVGIGNTKKTNEFITKKTDNNTIKTQEMWPTHEGFVKESYWNKINKLSGLITDLTKKKDEEDE